MTVYVFDDMSTETEFYSVIKTRLSSPKVKTPYREKKLLKRNFKIK